ncbi:hypothetical protein N7497_003774 [Penicillium chrysogenum]|nr:hypothetical protein N7497_003774 [Penicillium chrysogenum]
MRAGHCGVASSCACVSGQYGVPVHRRTTLKSPRFRYPIRACHNALEAWPTPKQSEIAYIVVLPSIMMRLMQKYDKDQGVVGVNDLERWPIDSAAVGFLSATETAESIKSLRNQPLLAGKHSPSDDLVVLARAALLSTSLNCIYDPGPKNC